ncbi:MAG: FAD-binding oxidoreductase, partial [Nitrososphaerales archaeon]
MNTVQSGSQHPLRADLISIVGSENVIDDIEQLEERYTRDTSPFPATSPGIVVRPSSAREVSEVMKLANSHKVRVAIRGAGTSLTGLPYADRQTIIVETRRLNRIVELDEVNMTVRAECGIIMGDLEKEATKRGFFVHTVTVPLHYVTLGGVLSGVVGGGLPPRRPAFGTGVNFLLGLKVVLPDGRILDTNAGGANIHQKSNYIKLGNGPDVTGLFIGDGGIFGTKVEATVEIFPEPRLKQADLRNFSDFAKVWKALSRLIELETLPYTQLRVRDMENRSSLEYVVE